jgi:hypothetical protein
LFRWCVFYVFKMLVKANSLPFSMMDSCIIFIYPNKNLLYSPSDFENTFETWIVKLLCHSNTLLYIRNMIWTIISRFESFGYLRVRLLHEPIHDAISAFYINMCEKENMREREREREREEMCERRLYIKTCRKKEFDFQIRFIYLFNECMLEKCRNTCLILVLYVCKYD